LILLASVFLMTGCGIFESSSAVRPPAELTRFGAEISPDVVWKAGTGKGIGDDFFKLAPMHTADTLVTIDSRGELSAWNKQSGDKLWDKSTELPVNTGANGNESIAVIGSTSGTVSAYSVTDGESLWTRELQSAISAISAGVDDQVIIRTKNGYIHALKLSDGETRWSINREVPALSLHTQSVPLIHDDKVLIGLDNGQLLALAADDGKVLWERAIATGRGRTELERMVDIDGRFVVDEEIAYVATYQGNLAAVNIVGGDVIWTKEASSVAGLSIDDERVFYTDSDDVVWALDKNLGESFWKQEDLQYRNLTVPVSHGDYVVAADFEGYLHWFAKDDGRMVAREKTGAAVITEPYVVDGLLYVLNAGGSLSVWRLPATP